VNIECKHYWLYFLECKNGKMKRITINTWQMGLLSKKGVCQRLLKEGKYWVWPSEKVETYDVTKPFNAPVELNILLQDDSLAKALHVVEVKDDEIALLFENGLLKQGINRRTLHFLEKHHQL
jgi:hypothetical protein